MIKKLLWPIMALLFLLNIGCQKKNFYSTQADGTTVRTFSTDYLKGKARLKYDENGSKVNAKANFRIKEDSIIWIQLSGTGGIEGGRFLANKDSIFFLDRLNKRVKKLSYDDLEKVYGYEVSLKQIQQIIYGNLISLKNETGVQKKGKKQGKQILKNKNDFLEMEYLVNPDSSYIHEVNIKDINANKTVKISYDNYREVDAQAFPAFNSLFFNFNKNGRNIEVSSEIKFYKIEAVEKGLKFPFTIPEKYEVE